MKHHFRIDVEIELKRELTPDLLENFTHGVIDIDAPYALKYLESGDSIRSSCTYIERPNVDVYGACQAISDALIALDDKQRANVLEWALSRVASIVDEKNGIIHEEHDFEGSMQVCSRCGRRRRDRLHAITTETDEA